MVFVRVLLWLHAANTVDVLYYQVPESAVIENVVECVISVGQGTDWDLPGWSESCLPEADSALLAVC